MNPNHPFVCKKCFRSPRAAGSPSLLHRGVAIFLCDVLGIRGWNCPHHSSSSGKFSFREKQGTPINWESFSWSVQSHRTSPVKPCDGNAGSTHVGYLSNWLQSSQSNGYMERIAFVSAYKNAFPDMLSSQRGYLPNAFASPHLNWGDTRMMNAGETIISSY